jgi:hypothetical protein
MTTTVHLPIEDAWRSTEPDVDENTDCDPVDVTVVGSSVQVHAHTQELLNKMGMGMDIESWNDYPAERRRCSTSSPPPTDGLER